MEKYTKHLQYVKFEEQWSRLRDVMEGSDKVKSMGEKYLPRLSGQTDKEYQSYITRANFVNLSSRIVNTNTGLMFKKDPTIKLPKSLEYLAQDTESFTSIYELFYTSVYETLLMGRVGVMLDVRDEKIVPVLYKTEDIVNWIAKKGVTYSVTLKELRDNDGIDEEEVIIRYDLIKDDKLDLVCRVTKLVGDDVQIIFPSYKGRLINFIPFCCINTKGIDFRPTKSPMLDVVDLNLSHYRSSADYEHGLHFVAMPTPVITGVSDISKVKIGASAIVLPDPNSRAFYLEFLGQGLSALEKSLSVKQAQISMFSARIQDTSTKGSESENIVKLRYSTDTATLHDIAVVVELLMRKVCEMALAWMGKVETGWVIELDKNFIDSRLSHQELATLSQCYMDGTIDKETYIYNLRRGQVIEEGHDMAINFKREESNNNQGLSVGHILGDK